MVNTSYKVINKLHKEAKKQNKTSNFEYPDESACMVLINKSCFMDYDVIIISSLENLKKINNDIPEADLIKKSKIGCPILVIDTFTTIKDANNCASELKTKYEYTLKNDNKKM